MAKLKDGSQVYGNFTVDTNLLVSTDATILGNLNVSGTVTTINSSTITIADPIAQYGRGADNAPLTTNDGMDRGLDLAYYNGTAKDAFMGWKNVSNTFVLASNVSIIDNVVTVDTYGNLTMGTITADGGGLSNIVGANVTGWVASANNANYAGTVTGSAQSNITSVGTLTSLTVSGISNVSAINSNGAFTTNNNITANGTSSQLMIGNATAGTGATANIYGNLNVTGKITGTIDATIGAKGADTNIQYNNAGNIDGSDGFTFNNVSNTVNIGQGITLSGDDGEANFNGTLNLNKLNSINVINDASSQGIELYSTEYSQLNYNNDAWVYVNSSGAFLESGGYYANLYASNGQFAVSNAFSAANGNFTADQNGNVNASGYGSFAEVYITDAVGSGGQINYINDADGKIIGDSSLTYVEGLLSASNLATGDANITGNITTKYTAGKLLTTDVGGNLVESTVAFSADTLTVANANVTDTTKTANLTITNLTTTGALLYTSGATGAVTESGNLTFNSSTKTLTTDNLTVSGDIIGNTVTSNNLVSTQLVFANGDKSLTGSAGLTFASDTLSANNITSSGHIRGATVQADNLVATRVVFSNTGGNLTSDEHFTFASDTLTANTIKAPTGIESSSVKANNLSTNSVVISGSGGELTQATGLEFSSATLSAPNIGVTGDITSGNVYANSGTVKAATLIGTLDTSSNAQPNITSVGTLIDLSVTGNVAAGGVKTDNLYYSNGAAWDLQQAAGDTTEIQFNNGDNFSASANFTFNAGTSTLTVTGTANATTVNATTGNITTVNSTTVNATTGNITTVNATTGNITTVNATDLNATGNANVSGYLKAGDTTIAGNLTVTGTTTSVNTTVSQLSDPLFDLGNGANGAALTSDDGKDRGLVMHTFNGATEATEDLFMGYDNSASEFVLAKNVTVVENLVDYGTTDAEKQANLADLRIGNIFAYNANFGGVVFSQGNVTLGSGSYINGNVNGNISGTITVTGGAGAIQYANAANALVSNSNFNFNESTVTLTVGDGSTTGNVVANLLTGTLTTNAQPNVTSVGTLTSLSIDSEGSVTGANLVSASYLTGTLTTNAQPNITSVGTLGNANVATTLNVASDAFIANATGIFTDGYYYANGDAIDFQTASGSAFELQFHADGTNDLAASSKLTFNPTTSNLTVNGNIITGSGSGGNISGANVVSATLFSGSGANLTNINGANVSLVDTAKQVTEGTQSNITSVGTLTSLTVNNTGGSGNITADNIAASSGNITAAFLIGDGYQISNIAGANVTGWVEQANIANVAYAVSGANITGTSLATGVVTSSLTSVGTLGSLTVTNDITSTTGKVLAGQIGNSSSYLYGDGSNISGVTASSIAAANITGTTLPSSIVNSSLQTVGTLSGLTSEGTVNFTNASNVALGNVANVHITGGTSGQYLQTNGSGTISWSTVELANIHNGTSNVAVAASGDVTAVVGGDTIITIATTGLTATGIITATGNITAANLISNAKIIASGTTDATDAITGAITTAGGISAQGNIYTGDAVGFAHGSGNTDSAAYIKYNATAGSIDFIFN